MKSPRRWTALAIGSLLLLSVASVAHAAPKRGAWSGTVAAVSGDNLILAGVPAHFRIAGGVIEMVSGRSLTARDLAPGTSVTLQVGEREADGRFRADLVVVEPKSPLTLTGTVDQIADDRRQIQVHGTEIEIDDHTGFSGRGTSGIVRSARDLRVGASVTASLAPTKAGTLRAAQIRAVSSSSEPGEDQEFQGVVNLIADTAWTIDTKVFGITDQTIFEGAPGLGDVVEVKFHADDTGALIADRIEKEDGVPGMEVELVGIVEGISDTSWTISGQVVAVNASTQIIGSPVMGDTVEVQAQKAGDGTLTAQVIKKEDAGGGDDQGDDNGNDGGNHDGGDDHGGQTGSGSGNQTGGGQTGGNNSAPDDNGHHGQGNGSGSDD